MILICIDHLYYNTNWDTVSQLREQKSHPDKKQSRVIATRLDTRMRLICVMPLTKRVADVVGRSAEERILGERFVLPELGGTAKSSNWKMKSRRKLLEIAAESPASGARFVGTLLTLDTNLINKS